MKSVNIKLNLLIRNICLHDNGYIALSKICRLSSDINSVELGFYNYTNYRCDHISMTSNYSGGGILFSVSNMFHSSLLMIPANSIEHVFGIIKIHLCHHR